MAAVDSNGRRLRAGRFYKAGTAIVYIRRVDGDRAYIRHQSECFKKREAPFSTPEILTPMPKREIKDYVHKLRYMESFVRQAIYGISDKLEACDIEDILEAIDKGQIELDEESATKRRRRSGLSKRVG